MNAADTINSVLLGGLLGVLGQGIRIAVGLKKLHTSNVNNAVNGQEQDDFSTSRLVISIFIGFVAGAIALMFKGKGVKDFSDKQLIVTIMAAGYSGADFIEGVFNTSLAKLNPQKADAGTSPAKVSDESLPANSLTKG